jgi:hypothetical protein
LNYTKLTDTIQATEGKAFITIDGSNRELFEVSALKAQIDLKVQEKRLLGHRMTQHKIVGATGTGSMTIYWMNSQMLQQTLKYIKNGTTSSISLQVMNEDPQSTVWRNMVVLLSVILASIPAAILDDGSEDPITFDTDFTFDDIENLESFVLPENYR